MRNKKKKLILPVTDDSGECYLSPSQISTWIKSKREYIRQRMMGEKFEGNAYTAFGGKVGVALENNDFEGFTQEEVNFLKTIPRSDEFETEIRLEMDGFYVKGYIDTNSKPEVVVALKAIPVGEYVKYLADYKTGDISNKMADYESDDYWQTDIYAAAMEQKFGVMPETTEVILIGRKGNPHKGEKLELTNKFITIKREITPERVQLVKDNVQAVAEEIAEYYAAYLKLNLL